ncbi:MAG: 50S ribosomal protein L35 [Myxococcota bacterium]|nr:50S ribosomal protein L35 [Myxococcota bacterium]
MPKMKSHSGAAKRFKRTGTGKITRAQKNKRHILTKKSSKRKRRLSAKAVVSSGLKKTLDQMLPR